MPWSPSLRRWGRAEPVFAQTDGGGGGSLGIRNSGYRTAAERLIDAYGDMRRSGNAFERQMMVSAYTDAVGEMNTGQ